MRTADFDHWKKGKKYKTTSVTKLSKRSSLEKSIIAFSLIGLLTTDFWWRGRASYHPSMVVRDDESQGSFFRLKTSYLLRVR